MAYDRYDERRRYRDPRSRQFANDREERGFFERARDEVSSWFGDEPSEQRRERDERFESRFDDDRFSGRDRSRTFAGDRDYSRFEQSPRWRDEGYRRPYTGRFSGGGGRGFGDDSYRPMTGDYGRSSDFEREQGLADQTFGEGWSRQDQRGFATSGSPAGATGLHDRDYSNWRTRQLDEFDRDYDEFRRENSSRFESEFSNWRGTRQAKRKLLGEVREHMQVVGSDDQPVGTVDKVRGDRIILTKDDSPDGRHHAISCSLVDRLEGDRVILDRTAEQAREQFSSEDRNRALFENDDRREEGPHILNRSFSGTY